MTKIVLDVEAMRAAIAAEHGFVARAAKRLGVGRITLLRRAREAGLDTQARQLREATGWTYGRPPRDEIAALDRQRACAFARYNASVRRAGE